MTLKVTIAEWHQRLSVPKSSLEAEMNKHPLSGSDLVPLNVQNLGLDRHRAAAQLAPLSQPCNRSVRDPKAGRSNRPLHSRLAVADRQFREN